MKFPAIIFIFIASFSPPIFAQAVQPDLASAHPVYNKIDMTFSWTEKSFSDALYHGTIKSFHLILSHAEFQAAFDIKEHSVTGPQLGIPHTIIVDPDELCHVQDTISGLIYLQNNIMKVEEDVLSAQAKAAIQAHIEKALTEALQAKTEVLTNPKSSDSRCRK